MDLLFMVDNSISMADKQQILAQAVPKLVDRLINPIQVCSDSQGHTIPAAGPSCGGQYPNGPKPEFRPVTDIHIGVVTSSLGGHGAPTNFCNPQGPDAQTGSARNDKSHLLPKVRTGLSSYQNMGFLAFNGTNGPEVGSDFANYVTVAGEQGCGFESSLEAWYRFLVDPAPPLTVTVTNNYSTPTGVDQEVLTERKNFLRPDSLLGIIMLTDEDDCSISDSGLGWLVARQDHMPRASAACATDPNGPCCRSCALSEASPPSGCQALKVDPSCTKGAFTDKEDPLNLRCFQEKKRFGLDLLYPTQRYVNALTQVQLCPQNPDLSCGTGDSPVANPIFANPSGSVRDPSLVFLAAITGVPWQDIATADTLKTANALKYKTAAQLVSGGIWEDILGDVNTYLAPKDPLMQESIDPRAGANPITGDAIAPPGTGQGNPINGHEYDIPDRDDLQYACIFPLPTPRKNGQDCANFGQPGASPDKPLCEKIPGASSGGTTQYFAKAYPGLRQLQVLKDFGDNAILASICPKVLDQKQRDYGYNPAVDAIVERFKSVWGQQCMPEALTPDPVTKQVPCTVVEARPSSVAGNCSMAGRAPVGSKLASAVRQRLKQMGRCDDAGQPACSDFNLCEITQLTEPSVLQSCLDDDPVQSGVNGFCYVDSQQGNPEFISSCPANERRTLRFVPQDKTPTPGAMVFLSCGG